MCDEWLNSVQEGKRKTLNTGDMNVVSRGLSQNHKERLGRECVWSDEWLNSVQEGKRKTRTRVT